MTYAIGRLIGREALSDVLGPRLNRVREKIRRRGVIAVALIRLVPLAPFTIVNLAAGASDIRLDAISCSAPRSACCPASSRWRRSASRSAT